MSKAVGATQPRVLIHEGYEDHEGKLGDPSWSSWISLRAAPLNQNATLLYLV